MPLPVDVHTGNRRPVRGFLGRLFQRPQRISPGDVPVPPVAARPSGVVDAHTRPFWAGTASPASRARLSALIDAHESGRDAQSRRPRGNPAFTEALFVELMRGRQYRRAFDQLSGECRQRWGSADAFAAAQGGALRRLRGVRVTDVRYLPEWVDPDAGTRYTEVAELRVEYTLGDDHTSRVLPRTVHLVPDQGKWRSLCYPD